MYPIAIDDPFCFYHAQFGPAYFVEYVRNDVDRAGRVPRSTGLLHLVGRRFLSREVGLIGTLLFISSNMHVH